MHTLSRAPSANTHEKNIIGGCTSETTERIAVHSQDLKQHNHSAPTPALRRQLVHNQVDALPMLNIM